MHPRNGRPPVRRVIHSDGRRGWRRVSAAAHTLEGMLIGSIRPVESREITVEAQSLAEIHEKLAAQMPTGWQLSDAPVRMTKGTITVTAVATIVRRDGGREIEAEDMAALQAQVPEGWQLVYVRKP